MKFKSYWFSNFIIISILFIVLFNCNSKTNIPLFDVQGPFSLNINTWKIHPIKDPEAVRKLFDTALSALPFPNASIGNNYILYEQNVDYLDLKKVAAYDSAGKHLIYVVSAVFKAKEKGDVVLMLGTEANIKVWGNGKSLSAMVEQQGLYKYGSYYKFPADEGTNTVLIALQFENSNERRLICSIGNLIHAIQNHHQQSWSNFLEHSFYDLRDTLKIKLPAYSGNLQYKLTIKNKNLEYSDTGSVRESAISLHLDGLTKGIYECLLVIAGLHYRQHFIVGLYDLQLETLQRELDPYTQTQPYVLNVQPLISRSENLKRYKVHKGQRKSYFSIETAAEEGYWQKAVEGFSTATRLGVSPHSVSEPKARFIKITGYGNTLHDWNAIAEVRVTGKKLQNGNEEELIIRNIVSSSYEGRNYPSHVYDNDLATCWESRGEQWLILDLEEEFILTSIDIAWKSGVANDKDVNEWERKMVFILAELHTALSDLQQKELPFRLKPGRHIPGYISTIDEKIENYIVQAPHNLNKEKKYPLILHILPRMETPSQLMESYLLADTRDLDRSQLAINRLGAIDVWAFARSFDSYLNNHNIAEYESILKDVEKYYNIDQTKVYLFATCSGFIKSVQLAERFPDTFAGIAASPVFYEDDSTLNINAGLKSLSKIPMFFVHAKEDELTPVQSLYRFKLLAEKNSLKATYKILNNTSRAFYVIEQYEFLYKELLESSIKREKNKNVTSYILSQRKYCPYPWLNFIGEMDKAGIKLEITTSPDTIHLNIHGITEIAISPVLWRDFYTTKMQLVVNHNNIRINDEEPVLINLEKSSVKKTTKILYKNSFIEGPINHAFSSKCLIVRGSIGSKNETAHIDHLVKNFSQAWYKYNFSNCRVLDDVKLAKEDIQSYHLILIGDENTNQYIKQHSGRLNRVNTKRRKDELKGSPIYILPNPDNPFRYIVHISNKGIPYIDDKVFKSIINSNFDYLFYVFNNHGFTTFGGGNFNSEWEL